MQDFEKGKLKHFQPALKHYDGLADRMNKNGHSLDVFACSLDQVGIAEMHPAVHYTGMPSCPKQHTFLLCLSLQACFRLQVYNKELPRFLEGFSKSLTCCQYYQFLQR